MITDGEYTKYWGKENLMRYEAAEVASLHIRLESRMFLENVGIPFGAYYFTPETATAQLPPITFACFDINNIPPVFRHHRLLGTRREMQDYRVHYCLSEPDGAVYAVHDYEMEQAEVFFVNSSVQKYAEFMFHLERWRNWFYDFGADESTENQLIAGRNLARALRDVDAAACVPQTPEDMTTEFGALICQVEHTGWTG